MQTTAEIIMALGGPTALAEALKRPVSTVTAWAHRGRIPPKHWAEVIAVANKKRVKLKMEQIAEAFVRGRGEVAA